MEGTGKRGRVCRGCRVRWPPLPAGLSACKPAPACGPRRREACGAVTAGRAAGQRAVLVLRGFPTPAFYQSAARNTFPPDLRAVLPGSCSLVFGMRRGLRHMAGGTKTFLQGKIIMSQPPSVIAYRHIILCSLAVSNWGVERDGGWRVPRSWLCRAEGLAGLVPVSCCV